MALYVVTGGAGFIGSHLVDALLAAGHAVRVVDDLSSGRRGNVDPRAEFVHGDVADAPLMRDLLSDAAGCFHLAAIASVARANEDWLGTHRSNLTGTIAVLDAARLAGLIPVVYASSAAIYGDQGSQPIRETARPRPMSAYGADKLGSELHADIAFGVHGVPTLGLRFFNVYGPRQDTDSPYSGVISIFAARLAAGQPVTINGDGRQTRDFVYVDDVVDHMLAGMRRLHAEPQADVLNVCTGRSTAVEDLVHALAHALGCAPRIQYALPRAGDIRCSLGDPAKSRVALRLAAGTSLADGLLRTLDSLCRSALSLVA